MFYSRGPKETETQNQQETVFKTKGGNTVNESTGSGIQDLTQSPPPPAPTPYCSLSAPALSMDGKAKPQGCGLTAPRSRLGALPHTWSGGWRSAAT